jgi:phosphoglycolate phosphatase-like HAD superfamily hydrolase
MTQAFEHVFGPLDGSSSMSKLAGVPMAGRTDTWIVSEMARIYGVVSDATSLGRFHDVYISHLSREIQLPGPRKGVLPGVRPLLEELQERDGVHLALLTGNFAAGARVKLEHFDLWRYFPCGAFAEDSPHRNDLLAHALTRVEACGGPLVQPSEVVVVGDTPHDVGVALAAGARAVGVATGSFDTLALRESGAHATLEDLSDLTAALEAFGL